MAEIIRMPRLSDTMEEGNIVGWLKKEGDKVSPGDILAEVETDKATMELESFHEGYLLHIGVKEGPAPVNAILAVIGAKGEDYKAALAKASAGDSTKPEEPIHIAESKAGTKEKASATSPNGEVSQSNQHVTENEFTGDENRLKSSPLARSMASREGIDIRTLTGSGDGGRVVKRDIENYFSNTGLQEKGDIETKKIPAPQFGEVPVSQMRKTIARRLVESKFSAPHFYLTMKINMDLAVDARKLINDQNGTENFI